MWGADTLLLIAATFVLAGLVKGVVGLGLPTVALAILTAALGLRDAMALMLVPSLATNVWQALAGPALGEIVRRFWPMGAAAVFGIFIGLKIGIGIAPDILAAVLGVVLCVYAASGMFRFNLPAVQRSAHTLTPLMGLASGVMTGLAGVFMVPGALYLQALRLPKELFVQTLGLLFVIATITLGAALSRYALLNQDQAMISTAAVIPAFAGLYLGQKIRARLSEDHFRTALYCALAGLGIFLILRALV